MRSSPPSTRRFACAVSTADKSKPLSPFKRIYRAAQQGANDYAPIFLPWSARPDRTPAWYMQQRRDVFARTGSYDDCDQEYPASDTEALQGRSLDKRFPAAWLDGCKAVRSPLADSFMSMPGLAVYALPDKDRAYVIGADPAEGNPQSDESAACVLDVGTGAQVAVMAGKFDPAIFGGYVESLAGWYNRAPVMVERNNHGHAVLLWLKEFGSVQVYAGLDGKPGWMTTGNSKPLLIDNAAGCYATGRPASRMRRRTCSLPCSTGQPCVRRKATTTTGRWRTCWLLRRYAGAAHYRTVGPAMTPSPQARHGSEPAAWTSYPLSQACVSSGATGSRAGPDSSLDSR
jgi:hypothetical protein